MKKIFLLFTLILLTSCNLSNNSEPSFNESISEITHGEIILNSSNCPKGEGQSYPEPKEYLINDHYFYFKDVMNGSGKFPNLNYIQMRKETSYFRNVSEIKGSTIFIKIIINSSAYTGDMTHELNVLCGENYNEYNSSLTATSYRDDTYLYVEINGKDYSYFSFENNSNYAAYIEEIKFVW
jgi:hypothetical protein